MGYVSSVAQDLQARERISSIGIASRVIFCGLVASGAARHDQPHPAPVEVALFWARGGMPHPSQVIPTLSGQNLHSAASLIYWQTAQLSDAAAACLTG